MRSLKVFESEMFRKQTCLSGLLFVCVPFLAAQTAYLKQTVGVGVGIGTPHGRFFGDLFTNAPGLVAEYGFRLHRNVQADVGLETLINGWGDNVCDLRYTSPATNAEFLVPFGGRGILPLNGGRVLLSLGGGGAYMKYTSPCRGSSFTNTSDAWGVYGLGAASVAVDAARRFRVGIVTRYYRAETQYYRKDR